VNYEIALINAFVSGSIRSMATSRITVAEIARQAGVSRSAASYALRDDPNIAPATRERIKRVAQQLGYRPDPVLAKLMAHLHVRRGTHYLGKLAFLNPSRDRDFLQRTHALREFFANAAVQAGALGYQTEEFWLYESGRSPKRLAQILLNRGINGIVLGSTGQPGSIVDFPWGKFTAVTVGYSVVSPSLNRVVTNHYRNTLLALRHVTEAGYRRIGLVVDKEEPTMENLHLAAFYVHQRALPVKQWIPACVSSGDIGALRAWFNRYRPDVILNADMPLQYLEKAGIRVPQDVALVSLLRWDDQAGIAGVLPGYERLGTSAINLLASQLHHNETGVPANPHIMLTEGSWIDGESLPVKR
jgi:LacI family transcriptional regulator